MYRIGQFRRTQLDSYSTELEMSLDRQQKEGITSTDLLFYNRCGNLFGDNIVNRFYSYYLRFGVTQRPDSEQVFYLKLHNPDQINDNEQLIENFVVGRGTGTTYFEVIITPNATYNQILWELQRAPLDYTMENDDGTYGRIMEVTIISFTRLVDVVGFLKSSYPDLSYLTKIGVQGPPSLLMSINGEQIRVGRNGIYEINNGINITSISFVPKTSTVSSDGLEYFIMDFEY